MRPILSMAWKDLRLLCRDKPAMFFAVFFPLLFATFFGYLFSGLGQRVRAPVKIAIVDEDQTPGSAALIRSLREADEVQVELFGYAGEAREAVRLQRQVAFLVIKPGFGAAADQPFWGRPGKLEIGADPARFAEAGLVEGLVTRRAFEQVQRALANPRQMRSSIQQAIERTRHENSETRNGLLKSFLESVDQMLAQLAAIQSADVSGGHRDASSALFRWSPVEIELVNISRERRGPSNSFAITFPQAIVWGLMSCAATFGISLVVERREGTLTRLQIAPIARWQILAGKALACFVATSVVAVLLLAVGAVFFSVSVHAPFLLALAVVCSCIAFVGLMMLLSVLGRTEASAGGIGWAVLLVMAMLGGAMTPVFLMPPWMQTLSGVSPVKWAILSMEGALWRRFSFEEMALPLAVLTSVGIAGFAAGARLMNWSARR